MTYVQPFYPVLVLSALMLVLLHRCKVPRNKPRLLVLAVSAIALFSWPPVAWLGSKTLEWRYPVEADPGEAVEAIVLLSGAVQPPEPERPVPLVGHDTYVRCRHAAWLFRHGHPVPVLLCGGNDPQRPGAGSFAHAMQEVVENEGVPASMTWLEERSTSTYENALYGAELLRARGIHKIALVTEAFHMRRAERSFQRQGIEVVPAPCGFRAARFQLTPRIVLPGDAAIHQNEDTLHEWIGYAWYLLRGRI